MTTLQAARLYDAMLFREPHKIRAQFPCHALPRALRFSYNAPPAKDAYKSATMEYRGDLLTTKQLLAQIQSVCVVLLERNEVKRAARQAHDALPESVAWVHGSSQLLSHLQWSQMPAIDTQPTHASLGPLLTRLLSYLSGRREDEDDPRWCHLEYSNTVLNVAAQVKAVMVAAAEEEANAKEVLDRDLNRYVHFRLSHQAQTVFNYISVTHTTNVASYSVRACLRSQLGIRNLQEAITDFKCASDAFESFHKGKESSPAKRKESRVILEASLVRYLESVERHARACLIFNHVKLIPSRVEHHLGDHAALLRQLLQGFTAEQEHRVKHTVAAFHNNVRLSLPAVAAKVVKGYNEKLASVIAKYDFYRQMLHHTSYEASQELQRHLLVVEHLAREWAAVIPRWARPSQEAVARLAEMRRKPHGKDKWCWPFKGDIPPSCKSVANEHFVLYVFELIHERINT